MSYFESNIIPTELLLETRANILSQLECPICQQLIRKGVQCSLSCQTVFCFSCIIPNIINKTITKCPTCREDINDVSNYKETPLSTVKNSFVSSLSMRCPNSIPHLDSDTPCPFIIAEIGTDGSHLNEHMKYCDYYKKMCSHHCDYIPNYISYGKNATEISVNSSNGDGPITFSYDNRTIRMFIISTTDHRITYYIPRKTYTHYTTFSSLIKNEDELLKLVFFDMNVQDVSFPFEMIHDANDGDKQCYSQDNKNNNNKNNKRKNLLRGEMYNNPKKICNSTTYPIYCLYWDKPTSMQHFQAVLKEFTKQLHICMEPMNVYGELEDHEKLQCPLTRVICNSYKCTARVYRYSISSHLQAVDHAHLIETFYKNELNKIETHYKNQVERLQSEHKECLHISTNQPVLINTLNSDFYTDTTWRYKLRINDYVDLQDNKQNWFVSKVVEISYSTYMVFECIGGGNGLYITKLKWTDLEHRIDIPAKRSQGVILTDRCNHDVILASHVIPCRKDFEKEPFFYADFANLHNEI